MSVPRATSQGGQPGRQAVLVPGVRNGSVFGLCDLVRQTAFEAHRWFRHGQFEKVYENSLANRLSRQGIEVKQQFPTPVYDEDGTLVGDYFVDLLVERTLVVELKACRALTNDHIAQVLGYLRASRLEHGMLINFGAPKLEVRKLVLSNGATEDRGNPKDLR